MTQLNRFTPQALLAAAAVLAGCNGTDTLVSSSTSAALTAAQCTYQTSNTEAQACFDTFEACKSAANADLAACQTALRSCLPLPPVGSHPGHGGAGDGNCPNMGGGASDGGMGHGGPGGHGGRGGRGRGSLAVDSAALQACHEALTACVAAGGTDCYQTEHDCAHAVFAAAFQAECAAATAACAKAGADAAECARITERCTQGVDGIPPDADGGSCQ
jgi:hypothetical protein